MGEKYLPGNESYLIRIKSPLVRPGLEIETVVSGKYLAKTLDYIFQEIREFNSKEKSKLVEKVKE